MSGTQQISGLSSGLDWRPMVDQLIAIEHRRVDLVMNNRSETQVKLDAWQDLNGRLSSLQSTVASLASSTSMDLFTAGLSSSSSTDADDVLSAAVGTTAAPGTYELQVLQLAQAEKLQSGGFSTKDEALGLSGEIVLGGTAVSIDSNDTLTQIRDKINGAGQGAAATVLSVDDDDHRLVLGAEDTGATGLRLADVGDGTVLRDLGLVGDSTELAHTTSDGAASDWFDDATSTVADLLGASNAPGATTVQVAGQNVSIDLSSGSLTAIAAAIDALTGVSAAVESELHDGAYRYRLDISGTTSFVDSASVLESLGVLAATHGDVAQVLQTGKTTTDRNAVDPMDATTRFRDLWSDGADADVDEGTDTITISGTDNDGNAVSGSYAIQTNDRVQDLLDEIESVFGGAVTAAVVDGTIQVTDNVAGNSQLSLSLVANNEGGGSLDFGAVETSEHGRERQLTAGQDAEMTIDGITLTRSTNTVDDAIEGVTLSLRTAPGTGTSVTLDVARDIDAIIGKVKSFVSDFNDVAEFVATQTRYDEENEKTGGPLFSDGTLKSVRADLWNVLTNQAPGLPDEYAILAQVGVHTDGAGKLELDESRLRSVLNSDFEDVRNLFTAQGSSSNGQIQYVSHTNDTQQGSYELNVTQAASRACIQGSVDLTVGLALADTLTLTDSSSGRQAVVALAAGLTTAEIVDAVNSELAAERTAQRVGTVANTSGGSAITASTAWNDIDGGVVAEVGDSIAISGTDRGGDAVSATYTVADGDTVGNLLETIEDAFGGDLVATISSEGRLVARDARIGDSDLSLTLDTSAIDNLDLGTFDDGGLNTEGRYALDLEAEVGSAGELVLRHDAYGSAEGFSVATVEAEGNLGLAAGEQLGEDLAGTLGGVAFSGTGASGVVDAEGMDADGLSVYYDGSASGVVGSVELGFGAAELLDRALYSIADQFDGYAADREDSLQSSVARLDDRISEMERRLDHRREMLVAQFVALEQMINRLNAQSAWLSNQLSGMGMG